MTSFKFIVVLCLCIGYVSSLKLPQNFQRCKVSAELDKGDNECLKNSIQEAINQLVINGNKDVGVPDLDPLKINRIMIEQGENRPIAIKLEYTNNELSGLTSVKVKSVSGKLSSPKNFEMLIKSTANQLVLTGPYKVNGKVLVLPIQGDGLSNMTMDNVDATVVIKCEPQTKNGKEYLKVNDFKLTLTTTRLHTNLGNLFNGNKALGDNMNKFLNENWKDIFNELKSSIEDAFGAIFQDYSKRFLERISFNNIFLVE